MHPATREVLRSEVRRHYGGARRSRGGWLAFMPSLRVRFAAGVALTLILFAAVVGVLKYDPASRHELARLNVEEALSEREIKPVREKPGSDTVAPASTKPTSRERGLVRRAKAPAEESLAVTSSPGTVQGVASTLVVPLEPGARSTGGMPWQAFSVKDGAMMVPNSGFRDDPLVLRGGGSATVEEPEAPVLARAARVRNSPATLAMLESPAAAPESVAPPAVPLAAADSVESATGAVTAPSSGAPSFAVLNRFTVIQSGRKIHFVDRDGSTYSGTLHVPDAGGQLGVAVGGAALASAGEKTRSVQSSEPGVLGQTSSSIPFTVLGTNNSLKQRVLFRGRLPRLTEPALQGQVWFSNVLANGGSAPLPDGPGRNIPSGRITGQALVGDQEVAVEVEAVGEAR